jgi:hypothetical protein
MDAKRFFAGLTVTALLTSSAMAGDWMAGDQLRELIAGNTTYGKHEKKDRHGYSYNREDGTFVGWNSEFGPTKGTWRVKGNQFCRHREGKSREFCHDVRANGDGSYNRYKQPKNLIKPRVHILTWTKVVPGNPENLK